MIALGVEEDKNEGLCLVCQSTIMIQHYIEKQQSVGSSVSVGQLLPVQLTDGQTVSQTDNRQCLLLQLKGL